MTRQSLYLRYRPQRFGEIKGQARLVDSLQAAVVSGAVGHAYLLHGPRGTGKTSTARVLAKALNCADLDTGGEPCCVCESCVSIAEGRSFDLMELDAASNNGVDDMRDLLARVALASPGRAKVYLLDEVHMLTTGAENALLKTLEEPPPHVTWLLATTEPHKVAATVRSRCQIHELGLVDADTMTDHVRGVVEDAGLEAGPADIDAAVDDGGGSVRDTLTALERIVAGGGTDAGDAPDAILAAVAGRDTAAALRALTAEVGRGRDPCTVGEAVFAGLRDAFLTAVAQPPPRMSRRQHARAADLSERLPAGVLADAAQTVGEALVAMRRAPDPRVGIEVALISVCQLDPGVTVEALAGRVADLEARVDAAAADTAVLSPQALCALRPQTPTQVVDWARRHLGVERAAVVARAEELQPDPRQRRSVEQLRVLWEDLVASAAEPVTAA